MTHKDRYGNMFPSINSPRTDVQLRGKVFTAKLQGAGGMAISTRRTGVDLEAWKECTVCEEFDHCYKLSMAKIALETGVMQSGW